MHWFYQTILTGAKIFFKVLYRHHVYGREHTHHGAAIIAGNHTSFYDPPILAISWPEEVHFLARETLFDFPLFGALIRALNTHPVSGDASDIKVFKTICAQLKEEKKIILFPEGTRSEEDVLGEIKPGIAFLMTLTHCAIIPAYIDGAYQVWGRKRRLPKLWGKTACVFGSPILWESFQHLDKKEAQKAIVLRLAESIEALRDWYKKGAQGTPP